MPTPLPNIRVRYPKNRKDPESPDRVDTRITPDLGTDRSLELESLPDVPEFVELRTYYQKQHTRHADCVAELRRITGWKVLPDFFKPTLAELIGACRSVILRVAPTQGEGRAALEAMAQISRTRLQQLGRTIDATVWPLADLNRELAGVGDDLRRWREDEERRLTVIVQLIAKSASRGQPPRHVEAARAKDRMAACIAGLLFGCGVVPATTCESVYPRLTAWALDKAERWEDRPGADERADPKEIAANGLKLWRSQGGSWVEKCTLTPG